MLQGPVARASGVSRGSERHPRAQRDELVNVACSAVPRWQLERFPHVVERKSRVRRFRAQSRPVSLPATLPATPAP